MRYARVKFKMSFKKTNIRILNQEIKYNGRLIFFASVFFIGG